MKKDKQELEIVQPPYPMEMLMAKPTNAARDEISDLREAVRRLEAKVEQLARVVVEHGTVCCHCGERLCHRAPHVPVRYWMRFGPQSWEYFSRDNPQAAKQAEREYYRRERPRPDTGFGEDRMLDYFK